MNNSDYIYKNSVFKTSTDSLEDIRNFVSKVLEQLNISEDVLYNITLAVDEASTNVIKHAYNKNEEGELIIELIYDKPKLSISIIDKGKGFIPEDIPQPDIKEYYKKHKVGGWGIYLMKSLMDEVNFYFEPGKRNIVALTKYLK